MSTISNKSIKVWDPLIRIFHWSLVCFFFIAYITEDDWMVIHSYAGYSVILLLCFRILWGVAGTKFARFSNFITSFSTIKSYLKQLFSGNAKHYLGHNPAGGMMIMILIISLILLTLSGLALFSTEGNGPLAGTFFTQWPAKPLEGIHEFLANFTILLVFVHICGVVISSMLHKENLIKSMTIGHKQLTDKSIFSCKSNKTLEK